MLREKEIACRGVFPPAPSLSVAGSWWQGMVARHGSLGCQEMAIIAGTPWLSVPLSTLSKVPLYVLRDIFPKCVHVQYVLAKGGINDRIPFSNSCFIREVLDTTYDMSKKDNYSTRLESPQPCFYHHTFSVLASLLLQSYLFWIYSYASVFNTTGGNACMTHTLLVNLFLQSIQYQNTADHHRLMHALAKINVC